MVKQAKVTVYWDDEASLVMDIAEYVGAVECDDSEEQTEVNYGCFFCPSEWIFEEFSAMLQEAGIRFSHENSN